MRIGLIPKSQQIEFDSPPKFSLIERRMVFEIPDGFKLYLRKLEAPTSIVGFILQYGYFKSSGKFFYVNVFNSEDIEAVCRWNEIDKNIIDWENYHTAIIYRQQEIIRTHFGILPFGKKEKQMTLSEATRLLKKQKRPDILFWILSEYLRSHKIELPTYHALSSLIRESIKKLDYYYSQTISFLLTEPVQNMLDGLLEKEEDSFV